MERVKVDTSSLVYRWIVVCTSQRKMLSLNVAWSVKEFGCVKVKHKSSMLRFIM